MGYKQDTDTNGVLENPRNMSDQKSTKHVMCFPSILADGENTRGFTSYTPNGVSRVFRDRLVLKDNYGHCENGAHIDWDFWG